MSPISGLNSPSVRPVPRHPDPNQFQKPAVGFSTIIGALKVPVVPGTERIRDPQENDRCDGFGLQGVS